MWIRFLGYAGVPVAVSIPCFFLAAMTAWRLVKAHKQAQRSRQYGLGSTGLSAPTQSQNMGQTFEYDNPPDYQLELRSNTSPVKSSRAALSPDSSIRKFHMPFGARAPSLGGISAISESKMDDLYEPESPTSSSFPTFAPPSDAPSLKSAKQWPGLSDKDYDLEDYQGDGLSDTVSSVPWGQSSPEQDGKELDQRHLTPMRLEPNREYTLPPYDLSEINSVCREISTTTTCATTATC